MFSILAAGDVCNGFALCHFFEVAGNNFSSLMLIGWKLLRMYISRIPVKLDRHAFRSATEVVFRPVEKAKHQGFCGRTPPESGWNRNPALDSGTPKTGTKAGMCNLVCIGRLKCVGNMSHTPFAFSEMVIV